MLTTNMNSQSRGFARPPLPPLNRKSRRWSPRSQGRPPLVKRGSPPPGKANLFHVIHKVPAGDSPYGRAKHVQLIEKDPNRAIPLFWAAIYAGDRVDSALKDMAVVMKQLNRSDEAIKAIKSFRHLCLLESQESLDNILVELYKKSGCTEELIEVLRHKLKNIEEGIAFGGEKTKSARSQGRKVQITIAQEYSRLLGNLAWAYMQQNNFKSAEEFYRKALSIEQDKNKQCNLAICLMHMNRVKEAKLLLQSIRVSPIDARSNDTYVKSFEHATQMLTDFESKSDEMEVAAEEESCKEIQMPFTSLAKRNLEEHSTFENGGQNQGGTRLLDEHNQGLYFQTQHEDTNNFSDSDSGFRHYTLFGLENCSEPSLHTLLFTALKKVCHGVENPYERTAEYLQKQLSTFYDKSYASPALASGIPEVEFTQPRCLCSFGYGDHIRAF